MGIVEGHSRPAPLKIGLPATSSNGESQTDLSQSEQWLKKRKVTSDETDGDTWFSAKNLEPLSSALGASVPVVQACGHLYNEVANLGIQ